MILTLKGPAAAARTRVAAVLPQEAGQPAQRGDLILDVREPAELAADGRIAGALHIPRGILGTRADATAETAESRLTKVRGTRRAHVLCAPDGRAALAADIRRKFSCHAGLIKASRGGGSLPARRSRSDP